MRLWRSRAATLLLILGASGLILVVSWLVLAYQFRHLARSLEDGLSSQLNEEAAILAVLCTGGTAGGTGALAGLASPERHLSLIAADGSTLYDSEAAPGSLQRLASRNDRPEVIAARAGGSGLARQEGMPGQAATLVAARSLGDGRVVEVASSIPFAGLLTGALFTSEITALMLAGMAVALLVVINHWRSENRVRELQEVSQAFSRGEFERRASIHGQGSLSRVGEELNRLGERLQRSLDDIAEQRRLLDSALDALAEGIACIDRLDRVVYANPAFRQLAAGGAEVIGQLFYEHLPAAAFTAALANARALAPSGTQAVELEHRRRQLRAVVVPAGAGLTVLVIHDLSESRLIEQARRDFMAAVSHEFKTPLTSILGFTDSLLAGGLDDPETARSFVEGISRQSDRLSNLVHDVLTLARLEQGGWEVRPETVDIRAFAQTLLEEYQPMGAGKRVHLELACSGPSTLVSDPELLRQLLGNLLSNAIRYNREDGTVRLRIDGDEEMLQLIVEDTGLGIPPEHQQRIFERFYRIDAHRSRQTGGTGLGLAIVKQLLGVLGGSIRLESTSGGTRFDIQLPRHGLHATASPPVPGQALASPGLPTLRMQPVPASAPAPASPDASTG